MHLIITVSNSIPLLGTVKYKVTIYPKTKRRNPKIERSQRRRKPKRPQNGPRSRMSPQLAILQILNSTPIKSKGKTLITRPFTFGYYFTTLLLLFF